MIYRTGETIEFWAFYVNSGSAATGLTVTATVYNSIGSVATPTVSEVGGGFYRCTYTPSADGAYVCVFTTAGTVDQADIAGIAFRGYAGVNHLNADIDSRADATDYTAARAAKLDNLDATVSSRSDFDSASDSVDIGSVNGIIVTSPDDFKCVAAGTGLEKIEFTVRDEFGDVIPKPLIEVRSLDETAILAAVAGDSNGIADIYLDPGNYTYYVYKNGYKSKSGVIAVVNDLDVSVVLEGISSASSVDICNIIFDGIGLSGIRQGSIVKIYLQETPSYYSTDYIILNNVIIGQFNSGGRCIIGILRGAKIQVEIPDANYIARGTVPNQDSVHFRDGNWLKEI